MAKLIAYGFPSRPVRGSIFPSARQWDGIATGIISGDTAEARTVPAGAVGISSALAITTVEDGIFRFTRSAHFCTGVIPFAVAPDAWARDMEGAASANRIKAKSFPAFA